MSVAKHNSSIGQLFTHILVFRLLCSKKKEKLQLEISNNMEPFVFAIFTLVELHVLLISHVLLELETTFI